MLFIEYKKIIIFLIISFCIVAFLVLLTFFLNKRTYKPSTRAPIECGSHALSSGRARVEVNFYIIAILFIIFEVEFIFLLPWMFYWQFTYEFSGIIIFIFLIILVLSLLFEYSQGQLNI